MLKLMIPRDFTFHILFYMSASATTTPPLPKLCTSPSRSSRRTSNARCNEMDAWEQCQHLGIHDFLQSNLRVFSAQQKKNLRKKCFAPHHSTPTSPISSTIPGCLVPCGLFSGLASFQLRQVSRELLEKTSGRWWLPILEDHPRYRKWLGSPPIYKPFI